MDSLVFVGAAPSNQALHLDFLRELKRPILVFRGGATAVFPRLRELAAGDSKDGDGDEDAKRTRHATPTRLKTK